MTHSNGWADPKTAWKKRAGPHNVTLASGQKVTIKVFGLGELVVRDAVPEHLRDTVALHLLNRDRGGIDAVLGKAMLDVDAGRMPDAEFQQRLRDAAELTKRLVVEAMVKPKITLEEIDAGDYPWEDIEQLMRLCTGQETFDSAGVTVGVERIDAWATFQREHADGPCLGDDCERCDRARGALSSLHVVQV